MRNAFLTIVRGMSKQDQDDLRLNFSQKQMSQHQSGNNKDHAGADATAFLRDFDGDRGSTMITPSRENGIFAALKNQSVTTAEPYCRNTMTRSRNASGSGVIKTRKHSGNNPAQNALLP